ncbi:hypothetical protein LJC02_01445 [Breznakia sp. OttesenSCG-928-G09]|nr:hypothetical protein [Breznakia sp. OttesenSCG-928-G09]
MIENIKYFLKEYYSFLILVLILIIVLIGIPLISHIETVRNLFESFFVYVDVKSYLSFAGSLVGAIISIFVILIQMNKNNKMQLKAQEAEQKRTWFSAMKKELQWMIDFWIEERECLRDNRKIFNTVVRLHKNGKITLKTLTNYSNEIKAIDNKLVLLLFGYQTFHEGHLIDNKDDEHTLIGLAHEILISYNMLIEYMGIIAEQINKDDLNYEDDYANTILEKFEVAEKNCDYAIGFFRRREQLLRR